MATDYGAGIYLTNSEDIPPSWDMDVTPSGDIRTISGSDELQKDIALSTSIRVGRELGGPITPVVRNRIKGRVSDALEDDVRIDSILSLTVNEVNDDNNKVEVVAEVNAVQDENIELVFEVV